MPDFLNMQSNRPGHVDIKLDLKDYVRAFDAKMSAEGSATEAQAAKAFNMEFKKIYDSLDGLLGATIWMDVLDEATHALPEEQRHAIEKSPAATMMSESFLELLKNSVGEAIERYYDSGKEIPAEITLSLDIDTASNPREVVMQVTDSGRGFRNKAFLEEINTEQGQKDYVDKSHGSERAIPSDRPPLFGGQGRGLRILIADKDGDALEESGRVKRYEKPEVSHIAFGNARDERGHIKGAQITLTTSIEPRELLVNKALDYKESMQNIRQDVSASPTTSSEATTEKGTETPSMFDLDMGFMDDWEEENAERFQGDSPVPPKMHQRPFPEGSDDEGETDEDEFDPDKEGHDDFSPRSPK